MNNEQTKAIEVIAAKLGTTTEYLWNVLLSQAPISAITTLIQLVLIIIGGIVLFKIHKRCVKKEVYDSYNGDSVVAIMLIVAIIWAVIAIVGFFCIEDVINGFFNPEYWALNKIISSIN